MNPSGAVVAITGAAGAIGAATARVLAERGALLVLADRPGTDLAALARDLGGDPLVVEMDLASEASIAALFAAVRRRFGRLDGLDNNAAATHLLATDGDVGHLEAAAWDAAHRVNARGTALACKHALPLLRERAGAIVNVSSTLSSGGHGDRVAYATSKAAVEALTRSVAARYGPEGIRCNAVAPGLVLSDAVVAAEPAGVLDRIRAETPLARLGTPRDVATAVAFLLSDAAAFVTGHCLVVDGGNGLR